MADENTTHTTLNLELNGSRATAGATLAARWAKALNSTTMLYGAVGATARVSGNLTPNESDKISSPSEMPTNDKSINVTQAYRLFNDVWAYTKGTNDLRKLTLGQTTDLVTRYPAMITKNAQAGMDQMNANIARVTSAIDHAQNHFIRLSKSQAFPDLPEELQKQIHVITANRFDPVRLEAITIGQFNQVAQAIKDVMDNKGGPQSISQSIANQNRGKATTAESHLTNFSEEMNNLYAQVSDVVKQVNRLPSPQSINENYQRVKTIIDYDPAAEVGVYAAAAASYELVPGKYAVFGVSDKKAKYVDADNMFKERLGNNKTKDALIPSSTQEWSVSLGAGTHPIAAMPPELARKLGITPSTGSTEYGVYATRSTSTEDFRGDRVRDVTTMTVAAQVIKELPSKGRYLYVDFGVKETHSALPSGPGGKSSGKQGFLQFGVNF